MIKREAGPGGNFIARRWFHRMGENMHRHAAALFGEGVPDKGGCRPNFINVFETLFHAGGEVFQFPEPHTDHIFPVRKSGSGMVEETGDLIAVQT